MGFAHLHSSKLCSVNKICKDINNRVLIMEAEIETETLSY